MEKRDDRKPDPRAASALKVGARRTLAGDGRVERSLSVRCPRREGAVGIATCLGCPDCEGLVRSGEGDELLCAVPPEIPPPLRLPAEQVGLAQIMTRDVICVRDDVSAESLAALLIDLAITGAPVVDERGRPIGVVSRSDLVQLELAEEGREAPDERGLERGLHAEPPSRGKVRDFMMPMAFTLPENASVAHAAALMVYENVHRIPVVATDGSVVGIIAALDILRWLAANAGFALPDRRGQAADEPR